MVEPIEECITLCGGELYATASSVLPFLEKIKKHLLPESTDPVYLSELKTSLREDIIARCELNLNRKVLLKCTFFDK